MSGLVSLLEGQLWPSFEAVFLSPEWTRKGDDAALEIDLDWRLTIFTTPTLVDGSFPANSVERGHLSAEGKVH